jgi:nucleotide-binding universal stress UspA family protein
MFKNVLVGVDGRPNARDAIALAAKLIDADGQLTLAHVHRDERVAREGSHKLLEQERTEADVGAELLSIASASPGRGLHEQAEEQGADLIVVGSCSHGVFGRAMLGDDTRAALNGAPCAVAIAPLGYAQHPTPITNVGVAYNGSPESTAALAVARELAAPTRATVHALEVVSIPSAAYGGLVAPTIGRASN